MPGGKPQIKEIVDAHIHRTGLAPSDLVLVVRDRAAASGLTRVEGERVAAVRGGFIDLSDGGRIPLHRVVELRSKGKTVWNARK